MEDFYKIIGIKATDSDRTIKDAYRRLALQLHPDKNFAPNATAQFQQLNRAWETLKDEDKRRAYDQQFACQQARLNYQAYREKKAREEDRKWREILANKKRDRDAKAAREAAEKQHSEAETKKQQKDQVKLMERVTKFEATMSEKIAKLAAKKEQKEAEAKNRRMKREDDYEKRRQDKRNGSLEEMIKQFKKVAGGEGAGQGEDDQESSQTNSSGQESSSFQDVRRSFDKPLRPGEQSSESVPLEEISEIRPKARFISPVYRNFQYWKARIANEYSIRFHELHLSRGRALAQISHFKVQIVKNEIVITAFNMRLHARKEDCTEYYVKLMASEGRTFDKAALEVLIDNHARELIDDGASSIARTEVKRLQSLTGQYHGHLADLAHDFEQREYFYRQTNVAMALAYLPLRQYSQNLMPEVTGRYSSIWKSLNRIPTGRKFYSYAPCRLTETPWHAVRTVASIDSISTRLCGRCHGELINAADHPPSRCVYCDIVVCQKCHVDLELLQEYTDWLLGEKDGSLFEIKEEMLPNTFDACDV